MAIASTRTAPRVKLHVPQIADRQVLLEARSFRGIQSAQDFFGTANTPLIEGDLLIINVGAPRGPTVAAFHKVTGKMVWGAGASGGRVTPRRCLRQLEAKRRVFVFAGGESQPPSGGCWRSIRRTGPSTLRSVAQAAAMNR